MQLPRLLIGERRKAFGLLLGNGLAQGALAVVSAWTVMRIFERFGDAGTIPWALFFCLAGAVAASARLRRSERVQAERLGQHYVRTVRRRLFTRLLSSDTREFRIQRKGAVLLKFVGDLSAIRRWISLGLARLIVAGVAVSIAFAALGWLYWPFAVGVGLVLAISASWILWRGPVVRRTIEDARRYQARLASNVTEKLNHIATVQAFDQVRRERRLVWRQSGRVLRASVRKAEMLGSMRATVDAAAGASVIVVLGLAFTLPAGEPSAGMVAAVISIIGFLTPPLRDLGRVQEYWLAAQVARANLAAVSEGARRLHSRRRRDALRVTEGSIRLRRVTLNGVLSGIDARAEGGSRVALLGANGSGKSTLLGLIGRLFDPDKGRVMIDGQNISRVRLSSLRRNVAYVSPDVPLIRGSLRKNLCYGAGSIEQRRLQQVLRECGLLELIERLGGLDARIAEGGGSLSQGERVQVALARALLRKPRILLLDEPDANLDAQALNILDKEVAIFPGTVIMATHRKSALLACDQAWFLREGRLEVRDDLLRGERQDVGNVVSLQMQVDSLARAMQRR